MTQTPQSRYTRQALRLFGDQIRAARIARAITAQKLAERAGVSRGLLHRVEAGDPGVSIGSAFELAAVLGIALFDDDAARLAPAIKQIEGTLTLLPKAARQSRKAVKDDF